MLPSVGVVVFTLRGMQHVDRCVESVEWADTIQLCELDDGRDGSVSRVKGTDWVLYLWGEERVDAQLAAAIQDTVRSANGHPADPCRVRVRSRLLNHWIEASCWGPVPSPRLLQAEADPYFTGWNPAGFGSVSGGVLPGWISDHSFEQVANGVDHLNVLSSLWARDQANAPGSPRDLLSLPVRVFSRLFFRNGLWFRGLPGISLCVLAGYTCVATAMKSWEIARGLGDGPPPEP